MRRALVTLVVVLASCTSSSSPSSPSPVPTGAAPPYGIDTVDWPSTSAGVAAIFRALPHHLAGHDRTDAGMLGPTSAVYGLFDPQGRRGDISIAAWSLDDEVGPPPGAPVDQLRSMLGLPTAGHEEFASPTRPTGLAYVGAEMPAGSATTQVLMWLVHDDPWVFSVAGKDEADREVGVRAVVEATSSVPPTTAGTPYGIDTVTWPGDRHSAGTVLGGLPPTLDGLRATAGTDEVTYGRAGAPAPAVPAITVRIVTPARGEGPLEAIPTLRSFLPTNGEADVTSTSLDPTLPLAWVLARGRLDADGRWAEDDGSAMFAWAAPESQVVYVVIASPAGRLDAVVAALARSAEAAGR